MIDDEDREDMIEVKSLEFLAARTPDDRRIAWAQLRELLNGRSAAQVAKMERERGLR